MSIEEQLAEEKRAHSQTIQAAEKLAEVLDVIRTALSDDAGGSYAPAYRYLEKLGLYSDDLQDVRVLSEVARAALAQYAAVRSGR